jgi:hypothetical protein
MLHNIRINLLWVVYCRMFVLSLTTKNREIFKDGERVHKLLGVPRYRDYRWN